MSTQSSPRTRLHVTEHLALHAELMLTSNHAHYLGQVLRMVLGDKIALFNGHDGEWEAEITELGKKRAQVLIRRQLRPQTTIADLWLLYAPLKGGRSEWVVEKATELGVSRICPVTTRFTVANRINSAKLSAIALEASEQCERLNLPEIAPLAPLETMLAQWPENRHLIYGDESGAADNARDILPGLASGCHAVLIGPEGGFSATELELLRGLPYVSGICMGPRVLRADTAAIAALSLVQAFCGDWEGKPAFRQNGIS